VNQYHKNKNQDFPSAATPRPFENDVSSFSDNSKFLEEMALDIKSYEDAEKCDIHSFVTFLNAPNVIQEFEKMDISIQSIDTLKNVCHAVILKQRPKPLLTVFNSFAHSNNSALRPRVVTIFNRYIALVHNQQDHARKVRENHVNDVNEQKSLAVAQILHLRNYYTQTPQDQMPIYRAGGESTDIESMKTQPRFDIGIVEEE
jgi:hypothetical protein